MADAVNSRDLDSSNERPQSIQGTRGESLVVLLVSQGVFQPQHVASGLAEQEEVVAVQTQRFARLLDLVDEVLDGPQIRVVGLVAVIRVELMLVDVLDTLGRQVTGEAFV